MIGSAATSMSSIFDKKVDISPPKAFGMTFKENPDMVIQPGDRLVKIAFKMEVGELIDSQIMQLIPLNFAKILVENLIAAEAGNNSGPQNNSNVSSPQSQPQQMPSQPQYQQPQQQQQYQQPQQQPQYQQPQYQQPQYNQMQQGMDQQHQPRFREPVNVQPAEFQAFDDGVISFERKNIGLIMDVPLQVTVELGRTNKYIRDILEFGPGSIIELDKLAEEPVDILVNGKVIAKGEVVVIDESFGVRITDIIHPSKRL
jgi:flagellar motor switch protein FliN/FliY